MNDWTNLIQDARPISLFFKNHAPDLSRLEVHEIRMVDRVGAIYLTFSLNDWPEDPPVKWTVRRSNALQVTLMLVDVSEVELKGVLKPDRYDIKLTKTNGVITLEVINQIFGFIVKCDAVYLDGVTDYIRGSPEIQ